MSHTLLCVLTTLEVSLLHFGASFSSYVGQHGKCENTHEHEKGEMNLIPVENAAYILTTGGGEDIEKNKLYGKP